jgi:ketosteroid isomerase-like protein
MWRLRLPSCDDATDKHIEFQFRLTMGLRKGDGQWRIAHEHHSIPAAD